MQGKGRSTLTLGETFYFSAGSEKSTLGVGDAPGTFAEEKTSFSLKFFRKRKKSSF
jgi:hypothetical protein